MEIGAIADTFEIQIREAFKSSPYPNRPSNKIRITRSNTELKALFNLPLNEPISMKLFHMTYLKPLVESIIKKDEFNIDYTAKIRLSRYLGIDFDISQKRKVLPPINKEGKEDILKVERERLLNFRKSNLNEVGNRHFNSLSVQKVIKEIKETRKYVAATPTQQRAFPFWLADRIGKLGLKDSLPDTPTFDPCGNLSDEMTKYLWSSFINLTKRLDLQDKDSSLDNREEIACCTDNVRLLYRFKDNVTFLRGLVCQMDKNLNKEVRDKNDAIKKRLKELGHPTH
jgi:hypothetical protein